MALTQWSAFNLTVGSFFILIICVGLMCKVFGPNKRFGDVVPVIPFIIFVLVVFNIIYLLIASFIGPELVSLVAGVITLLVGLGTARAGFLQPKEIWTFAEKSQWEESWLAKSEVSAPKVSDMNIIKAFLPYFIIILVLVGTRVSQNVGMDWANAMKSFTIGTGESGIILGQNWNWAVLWSPGLVFVLTALITVALHGMQGGEVKQAWINSLKQVKGAAIALFFGVAMVNIFRYTGMTNPDLVLVDGLGAGASMLTVMAKGLADLFQGAYVIVAPLIGVLGAFMSGSNTVSNTLFAPLQFETATMLGMSQVLIVALQNNGGAIGNMVCVNNVVAACATTGTSGNEGLIIKTNVLPMIIYCVIVVAVVAVAMALGVNPVPLAA